MRTSLALLALASTSPAFAGKVFDPNNPNPPPEQTTAQICASAIEQKRLQLGARIGTAYGQLRVFPGQWCMQMFTSGRIHTAAPTGGSTAAIMGAMSTKFALLGAESSFGRAIADSTEMSTNLTKQQFTGGFIISHPSFGVRAIHHPLAGLWQLNRSDERFGYPTSDQLASPYGLGTYSRLEHGYVARTWRWASGSISPGLAKAGSQPR